nr:hypothetical protein [uncultured Tolumonas sp.]
MIDNPDDITKWATAIKQLPTLLDSLSIIFSSPWGWLILFISVLWLAQILKISEVVVLYKSNRDNKLAMLNEYITNSSGDPEIIKIAKDVRDAYYFRYATKIYAEGYYREALIELSKNVKHVATWDDIRRSLEFSECKCSKITYKKLNWINNAKFWFNKSFGLICGLLSLVLFVFSVFLFFTKNATLHEFFVLLIEAIVIFLIGLWSLSLNWPYSAAKKISDALETKANPRQEV